MKASVITDELSGDFDTALELAVDLGFEGVEIRGVGEGRFPRVTDLMQQAVPQLCTEYGLPVVSLSPGLFKIRFPEPISNDARALQWDHRLSFDELQTARENLRIHVDELLPATIDAARTLGCPLVNVFSFERGDSGPESQIPQGVVETLKHAARQAALVGIVLSIENEATCWASTSATAAELVEMIGEPNVGITWDPANAFRVGEDDAFPRGYARVRSLVRHVHFKNAQIDPQSGNRRFSFEGVIDWRGQLAALEQDGYGGFISIETHQRPKLKTTRKYLELLRSLARQPDDRGGLT
jgi:sugar phosphate isomerase/epimerase